MLPGAVCAERLLRSADLEVLSFAGAEEFLSFEPDERQSCLVLDLAMPGQPFAECQHMKLVRSGD